MQPTTRIRNKNTTWSDRLRPRIGDVVLDSGSYYSNLTGYNAPLTDTLVWMPIYSPGGGGSAPIQINKTSADIQGVDPAFYIDLSSDLANPYPASLRVYFNPDTTDPGSAYQSLEPLQYYPEGELLYGFSDPAAFPNQDIKIFVI